MPLISPKQNISPVFYPGDKWRVNPVMGDALHTLPENWPNFDSLVTEDDEPVDNIFSEKQQRLLTESLYSSREKLGQDKPFLTLANVGVFYALNKPAIVPDVLVSLDVKMPHDVWRKSNRCYFVSKYGKPPEVAIEIVSNLKGKETGTKFKDYATAKVRYYVIFDPENQLKKGVLRVYELHNKDYVEKTDNWLSEINLGLALWEGYFEDKHDIWLRWCDSESQLVLTGAENSEKQRIAKEKAQKQAEQECLAKEQAQKQAEQECMAKEQAQQQAKQERLAKEQAQQHVERLASQLRAMGIDPDKLSE
ncbi:Uma2 family endonuclease [Candidatus Parabeggiatoa sp. HSG14]|uniref:Uma2 family endonuclease n=1 Tax=Candidatus Parabeggiatoa sp. HSG14 TaxID=3055593 RepID=UPI0025A6EA6F|nr:Uma2 family endonuclease [Thiotrichales bacterium HSG14]